MAELAQFPLSGGGVVVVETDAADMSARRVMRGGGAETAIATANATFESALQTIRSVAEGILNQLRSLAEPPDEVAVEFGVKMSAETGAVIAKASTEANFKINLSWKKSPPSVK
jgi:non-ribosomal peptide synthetase component E (peptide arylation enzyme)